MGDHKSKKILNYYMTTFASATSADGSVNHMLKAAKWVPIQNEVTRAKKDTCTLF